MNFIHTADWQLGKPYSRLTDSTKRARLQHERIAAIDRIASAVSEHKAAFVLVAGDLFDSQTPDKATVSAACAAIGRMGVPVIAIPGNHDFGGPGSIWEQKFFLTEKEQLAPNFHILLRPEPFVLAEAVIFPAPLLQRHTQTDPTQWIRTAFDETEFPDLPRIVLAHGTIQSFGPSGNGFEDDPSSAPNLIDLSRLPTPEIDYIALGDWHGTRKITDGKAWYSGTHEIDRFPRGDSNDPGNILRIAATRGQPTEVVSIRTAGFAWHETAFTFTEDASLGSLKTSLDELIGSEGGAKLLHLTLTGSLGLTAAGELTAFLEALESRLLRLKLYDKTSIAPTEDEIQALAERPSDPLVSQVAARLLDLSKSPDQSETALLALRHLHAALNR